MHDMYMITRAEYITAHVRHSKQITMRGASKLNPSTTAQYWIGDDLFLESITEKDKCPRYYANRKFLTIIEALDTTEAQAEIEAVKRFANH